MTKKTTGNGYSRRQLLAGAGAAVASVGVLTLGSRKAVAGHDWSHETDVLVVGGGAGGCSAAVSAHDAGSQVLLVEKADFIGGTAMKSAGVLWIPNNFVLRANGVEDRREDCLAYMARYSAPGRYVANAPNFGLEEAEVALLGAFYDNASAAIDSLRESKTLSLAEWRGFALDKAAVDYFDQAEENRVTTGRPLGPLTADGAMGLGAEMMAQFSAAIEKRGIATLLGHRAAKLVKDADGRVIGLVVTKGDDRISIRARKGVIFATGGYAHNPDYLRRYQRARFFGACAMPMSEGDFIGLAGAAGARMGDLGTAWRTQVLLEECLQSSQLAAGVFFPPGDSMIQVNRYGKRALNEHRNYNDRTEAHGIYRETTAEFPNQVMYMVYDQRCAEAFAGAYPFPAPGADPGYVISGATIAELTAGISARLAEIEAGTGGAALAPDFAANLEKTIARFNGFAKSGKDEDFGRGSSGYDPYWHEVFSPMNPDSGHKPHAFPSITMHPISSDGPYHAMMLVAGALDTCGGPAINGNAQVLDTHGQPIPGLYGAGNCIASPSKEAYFGAGHTLGMAVTFGYIAARHAHGAGS